MKKLFISKALLIGLLEVGCNNVSSWSDGVLNVCPKSDSIHRPLSLPPEYDSYHQLGQFRRSRSFPVYGLRRGSNDFSRCVFHNLVVQEPYFEQIKSGEKTIEGRAGNKDPNRGLMEDYKHQQTQYKIGDYIRFKVNSSSSKVTPKSIFYKIVKIDFYNSFSEMLGDHLSNCLPGITTIEKGVQLYRSFPNYSQREKDYGVVAIGIKAVNSKAMKSAV